MDKQPIFKKRIYGIRKSEKYICQVTGCGVDCGDQGTLDRHIKREHPELYNICGEAADQKSWA